MYRRQIKEKSADLFCFANKKVERLHSSKRLDVNERNADD